MHSSQVLFKNIFKTARYLSRVFHILYRFRWPWPIFKVTKESGSKIIKIAFPILSASWLDICSCVLFLKADWDLDSIKCVVMIGVRTSVWPCVSKTWMWTFYQRHGVSKIFRKSKYTLFAVENTKWMGLRLSFYERIKLAKKKKQLSWPFSCPCLLPIQMRLCFSDDSASALPL